VINVKRPVLYVRQPIKLTIVDILRLAGVSITDAEENIPLSKLNASGYGNIKWTVANYPSGDGYRIQLNVKDTPGLSAPFKTIMIFVEPKSAKVTPATAAQRKLLPTPPAGMKWGVDEDGDPTLYIPTRTLVTPTSPLGALPQTGDSIILTIPTMFAAAGVALLAVLRRRKRTQLSD